MAIIFIIRIAVYSWILSFIMCPASLSNAFYFLVWPENVFIGIETFRIIVTANLSVAIHITVVGSSSATAMNMVAESLELLDEEWSSSALPLT